MTNPCEDINYGSAAASGIAAALGSYIGSGLAKWGMKPKWAPILYGSGAVAAPVNVGLTGATQPVNR